ncbi:MAG: hypothetical protein H0V47_01125 [Chloroflexia bacterium]|nr:hypothetical protein [Chloroflexia bacterium]
MKEPEFTSPSLISRVLRDPVRLRRGAWLAALAVSLGGGVAGSGWAAVGSFAAILMALVWLLVPVVATGIGMGDAFFLRHGIGQRRVTIMLVLSTVAALVSCVVLAVASRPESQQELLSGALYLLLTLAVISWLAAVIGLGVGRSDGYLSRRIQNVDDRGW